MISRAGSCLEGRGNTPTCSLNTIKKNERKGERMSRIVDVLLFCFGYHADHTQIACDRTAHARTPALYSREARNGPFPRRGGPMAWKEWPMSAKLLTTTNPYRIEGA